MSALSPQAASSSAHVPWRIVWPIAGVVAAVGAVLLLAWGGRRRRRIAKVASAHLGVGSSGPDQGRGPGGRKVTRMQGYLYFSGRHQDEGNVGRP